MPKLPPITVIFGAFFLALAATLLAVGRPVKAEQRIEKRLADGKSVPTHFYVEPWLWRGLVVNTGLAALLLAGSGIASRKLKEEHPKLTGVGTTFGQWSLVLIGVSMVLAAVQNKDRLGQSLWGDEEWVMKRLIADEVTQHPDGSVSLTKTPWSETLWFFSRGSNHIAQTVVSRLCHDAFFKPSTGPNDPWFSETLVRLPSYIAGLLSILALAWAARVWGWADGIWVALLYYVLHPWFVRFGVDARGYGFVLLLVPLVIGLAGRAMQTGRWRWWLALGFAEFLLFWSYFGTLYILVALNASLLLMLWKCPELGEDRTVFVTRWFVAQVLAAMLVIGLMAPCLPQLLTFMKQKPLSGHMDLAWWQDALGYTLYGVPWHNWEVGNPLVVSFDQMSGLEVGGFITGVVAFLVCGTIAVRRLWQRSWEHHCLLAFFLGAPALMMLHTMKMGVRPYHWYLVPYFPALILLFAAAFSSFMPWLIGAWRRWFGSRKLGQEAFEFSISSFVTALFAMLGLGVLMFIARPQTRLLTLHPIEANRESMALIRSVTNPRHPDYGKDALTAGFVFYTEAYDPAMIRFQTAEELRSLIARADAEKRPLFLNFSNRLFCETFYPEVMKLIQDKSQFEPVKVLYGLFECSTREIYKHSPR